jgi:hypothetical protein
MGQCNPASGQLQVVSIASKQRCGASFKFCNIQVKVKVSEMEKHHFAFPEPDPEQHQYDAVNRSRVESKWLNFLARRWNRIKMSQLHNTDSDIYMRFWM